MKDSRIGTFACIGIIMNLLIKFIGYTGVLNTYSSYIIILLPMISRCGIILISYIGKPAKEVGSGNLFINTVGIAQVFTNYIIFSIMAFFIVNIDKLIIILAASIIVTILFNKYCISKINGITGDSLGAENELIIILLLIILSARI